MKKLLAFALVALMAGSSFAALGWFNDYLSVSVNGGGDTQYDVVGAGTQWDTADLGTLYSLTLTDIDFSYWSDTQDRGGGSLFFTVLDSLDQTVVAQTEIVWSQAYLGGNDYQGTWSTGQNLLSGGSFTATEDYQVVVWAKSWDTGSGQGDSWLSNGGANYIATFTYEDAPIPEPATMSLLGLGALALALRRKIRK